jgi:hypothetical protein
MEQESTSLQQQQQSSSFINYVSTFITNTLSDSDYIYNAESDTSSDDDEENYDEKSSSSREKSSVSDDSALMMKEEEEELSTTEQQHLQHDLVRLSLHKDYNISEYLNRRDKFGVINDVHLNMGFEPRNPKTTMSRAEYLNNALNKQSVDNSELRISNVSHVSNGEEDYGYFYASDLVGTTHENSPPKQQQQQKSNKSHRSKKRTQMHEQVVYEDVELDYFIVTKLYNPMGQLMDQYISNPSYGYWMNEYEKRHDPQTKQFIDQIHSNTLNIMPFRSLHFDETRRGKPRNNSNVTTNKKKQSPTTSETVSSSSSGEKLKSDKTSYAFDQLTVCLQQPDNLLKRRMLLKTNSKSQQQQQQQNPSDQTSVTAAHNEGIYYILCYAMFPNIRKQLATTRTKLSNKKVKLVKRIPRTDKFWTRVLVRSDDSSNGNSNDTDTSPLPQKELCRYVSQISIPDEFYARHDVKLLPRSQLVGMLYYTNDKDAWSFRASNDFKLIPPTMLIVRVSEARNLTKGQQSNPDFSNMTDNNITGDFYCSITYRDKKYYTETVHKTSHPVFKESDFAL